ncbi:hypothetical protein BC828DRAFT_391112 [Blastocladiella britannica]|nr:hypothetical protein BC828DRAFT_391112 [Blastocladiella britannica]
MELEHRKLRVAILGATGTVGQRFVSLLANHPFFVVHAVCASSRSAGRPYGAAAAWKLPGSIPKATAALVIETCDAVRPGTRLAACDVAFSGLDSSVATEIEAAVARAGIPVYSNAKNYRMHANVPLVVPTANAHHIKPMAASQVARGGALHLLPAPSASKSGEVVIERAGGFIVTNSNCSTTGFAVVLSALTTAFGRSNAVTQAHVVTMQAVSGAGYPGLPVLDVFDNVVPFIDGEEDKLETEPLKILGTVATDGTCVADFDGLRVSAACNRVPVLDGHTLTLSLKFAAGADGTVPSPAAVEEALRSYVPPCIDTLLQCPSYPRGSDGDDTDGPIHVTAESDRPQPRLDRDRGRGMTVTVGRVRACNLLDVKMVVLTHNTLLGAAGAALLNAEVSVVHGLLLPLS